MLERTRSDATSRAMETATHSQKPRNPRQGFQPGVSGNPKGAESKEAKHSKRVALICQWAAPYGGMASLQPAEIDLLHQAAELALRRQPPKSEDAVRVANTISKILAQCGLCDRRRRRSKPEPPGPFDALLGARDRR